MKVIANEETIKVPRCGHGSSTVCLLPPFWFGAVYGVQEDWSTLRKSERRAPISHNSNWGARGIPQQFHYCANWNIPSGISFKASPMHLQSWLNFGGEINTFWVSAFAFAIYQCRTKYLPSSFSEAEFTILEVIKKCHGHWRRFSQKVPECL